MGMRQAESAGGGHPADNQPRMTRRSETESPATLGVPLATPSHRRYRVASGMRYLLRGDGPSWGSFTRAHSDRAGCSRSYWLGSPGAGHGAEVKP